MAIGIKVKKVKKGTDQGVSKFFGDPTIPNAWAENWSDDVLFFCQIKLSDIAALDTENRLLHTGYLYVFLDIESYPYTPMVYYYDGEPDTVIDEFNKNEPKFAHLCDAWEMSFETVTDDAEGMKLLGIPADWSYAEAPPKLFMQYDPLVENIGFLDSVDGFAYFFFGENETDYENISLHIERS